MAAIDTQRKLAKASFARAAKLDPSRAHPHVMLAQIDLLEHHDDEARAHLQDALATDPDAAIDHSLFDRTLAWQDRAKAYADVLARYRATPGAKAAKGATLRWMKAVPSTQGNNGLAHRV